ncbi:MAG: thioredoxin family protein [Armatimonadetes bacterium]|nr:thioredoxin family protein [Armatimonadota bacterium]
MTQPTQEPTTTDGHAVVTTNEWIESGARLLEKEKELTRLRDEVARMRRNQPWTPVDQDYVFEGPDGPIKLSDLFGDKSQLIVYHFMFAPGDRDGCPGCSFVCDHMDSARQHFEHNNIGIVAVSRAPLADFAPFKRRMGWTFRWVSSAGSSFNYDFGVSYRPEDYSKGPVLHNFKMQTLSSEEQPGLTVLYKDTDGKIYRTYSTYERGLDLLIGAYNFIDLVPQGRNESSPMDWMRHHDRYED